MGIGSLFNVHKRGRRKVNIYAVGEPLNQRLSRYHRALLDFYCAEVQPGIGRRHALEDAIDNYLVPKILDATDYSEEMLRETVQGAIRQRLRELGGLGETEAAPDAQPDPDWLQPDRMVGPEPKVEPESTQSGLKVYFTNVEQALNWRRHGHEVDDLPCWDQDNPVDQTILDDDEWAWAAWQMCQEGLSVLNEEWPEATIMRALCLYEASAFDGDLSAIKPRYRDKAVELEAFPPERFEPEVEF